MSFFEDLANGAVDVAKGVGDFIHNAGDVVGGAVKQGVSKVAEEIVPDDDTKENVTLKQMFREMQEAVAIDDIKDAKEEMKSMAQAGVDEMTDMINDRLKFPATVMSKADSKEEMARLMPLLYPGLGLKDKSVNEIMSEMDEIGGFDKLKQYSKDIVAAQTPEDMLQAAMDGLQGIYETIDEQDEIVREKIKQDAEANKNDNPFKGVSAFNSSVNPSNKSSVSVDRGKTVDADLGVIPNATDTLQAGLGE